MKLVVFGDSFPNGLIKYPTRNSKEVREKINFGTQLIQLENTFTEVCNYAMSGCNNAMIFDTILQCLKQHTDNVFFLVCWTSPTRRYFYDYGVERYDNIPKKFYSMTNELNENLELAKFIGTCSSLLHYFDIPFAQTNSFYPLPIENPFTVDYYKKCNVIKAEYPITNTLFDIMAETFCTDKNVRQNYDDNHDKFNIDPNEYIAGCLHPTELGHKKIAQVLNPVIESYLPKP